MKWLDAGGGLVAAWMAQADGRGGSILEELYGLKDLFILLLAFGLVGLMIWLMKSHNTVKGFVIRVTDQGVNFTGQFPQGMQMEVIEFLRNDVAVEVEYEIRGRWDEQLLVVVVKGAAEPMEQRIRNYLKLTLKRP